VLDLLKKGGFERPLPIQAQAIPAIMSGRDVIGIAKTGSGKTLAFVLPMIRHVKDQPALVQGDGMVALGMAPTRELVTQVRAAACAVVAVVLLLLALLLLLSWYPSRPGGCAPECVSLMGSCPLPRAQIGKEIKRFGKVVGLSCTCVYGGSGVANQITELKRGAEIVICTPGRMIDILVTGRITNLRRVTYLVSWMVGCVP
jgi:ATP-dependent RNA helicase DDX46/PRP5